MAIQKINADLQLDDSTILNDSGDIIIDSDGTITTSQITYVNFNGDLSSIVFKTPLVQGTILEANVETSLKGGSILSNKVFRVDDFILTLGSGTTGSTSFETGKTQVVFNNVGSSAQMTIADANGVRKSFNLKMLDKVEVYESDSSKVTKLDSITSVSSDVIETLNLSGGTGSTVTTEKSTGAGPKSDCYDKCATAGYGTGSQELLNCRTKCASGNYGSKTMSANLDGVLTQNTVLQILNEDVVTVYDVLNLSGGTGSTVTTEKSTGAGPKSDCYDKCATAGYGTGSQELLNCRTKCASGNYGSKTMSANLDGVLTQNTVLQILNEDVVTVYDVLNLSGGTGSTVTTEKSTGAGPKSDCYDKCATAGYGTGSQELLNCRTKCASGNYGSKTMSANLDGVLTQNTVLQILNEDVVTVYDVLNLSGGTGSTVTTEKSTGAGPKSDCYDKCATAGYGTGSQELLNCRTKCASGNYGSKTMSANLDGVLTQNTVLQILNEDVVTVYDVLNLSGGTGSTVTTEKSTGAGPKSDCYDKCATAGYGTGSQELLNCRTKCASGNYGSKTMSANLDGVLTQNTVLQILNEDVVTVYDVLNLSGGTGSTVTTEKSTGAGPKSDCYDKCATAGYGTGSQELLNCRTKCASGNYGSKTMSANLDGVLTQNTVLQILNEDVVTVYDVLNLSGGTGSTVTTEKSTGAGPKSDCYDKCATAGYGTGSQELLNCRTKCASGNYGSKTMSANLDGVLTQNTILQILNEDVVTVYDVLNLSGGTGSTVTTEKSTGGGVRACTKACNGDLECIEKCNEGTPFGSKTMSANLDGILSSKNSILQILNEDVVTVYNVLNLSGDTGNTVTTEKSTGVGITSYQPFSRGVRELVGGVNNDKWEVVYGVGPTEVYGITYSSMTGTVKTMSSTVLQTTLHDDALKITNSTVSVPILNIATVGGAASITNLGIASDGTVVSGTSGGGTTKYAANVVFTGGVSQTITHNLASTDVIVQLKDSTGQLIIPNIVNNYVSNDVDIEVSVSGTYRVIIMS